MRGKPAGVKATDTPADAFAQLNRAVDPECGILCVRKYPISTGTAL